MNEETLHVVRGSSAAGGVLYSGVAERSALLIQPDVLSAGRLERYRSAEAWYSARDTEWRSLLSELGEAAPPPQHNDRMERADLLKQWRRFANAKKLVLWAGCGVADQWFLASAVYLADLLGYDVTRISVVQFERRPVGHGMVQGIGELNPDQIREGFHPVMLSPHRCAALRTLWNAVTAAEPKQLVMLSRLEAAEYSLIRRAVADYLTRFPDYGSGLSVWESALLEGVGSGRRRVNSVVGNAMKNNIATLDHVSDSYLFARLMRMALGVAEPAVSYSGGAAREDPGEVELTSFGKSLRAGSAHWIKTNGIDRWLGGIHLSSELATVWYRKGATLLI